MGFYVYKYLLGFFFFLSYLFCMTNFLEGASILLTFYLSFFPNIFICSHLLSSCFFCSGGGVGVLLPKVEVIN